MISVSRLSCICVCQHVLQTIAKVVTVVQSHQLIAIEETVADE